jgi:hypothetical protein
LYLLLLLALPLLDCQALADLLLQHQGCVAVVLLPLAYPGVSVVVCQLTWRQGQQPVWQWTSRQKTL